MPRFNIVGQKWRNLDPYLPGITAGCEAVLVRESNNQYDPNAVAVWIDGIHVGYLRKEDNKDIAKRIDAEGEDWRPDDHPLGIAADGAIVFPATSKAIRATFARSPNSAYPQVEID
jgi:hypothetical protein